MVETKLNTEKITLDAIQLLGKMNDSRLGLEDCQDLFLKGLSTLFANEYAILLLTDSEGGTAAVKKSVVSSKNVVVNDNVNLTAGIMNKCYQDLKMINEVIADGSLLEPSIDSVPGVEVHALTCAPLIYQSMLFGILAL
jgi:hypothetical protein